MREEIFFYGEEGEKGMKRKPNDFNYFLRERNFVCRRCLYIRCVSKGREEQKKRDFVQKELLFVRKAEAFVNDE